MKMTVLNEGAQLRIEAENDADLAVVCWLAFDHDPRARLGRALQLWRPSNEAESRKDVLASCLRGEGWKLCYGLELDMARLSYVETLPAPEQTLRADTAARIGHALLDGFELLWRDAQ